MTLTLKDFIVSTEKWKQLSSIKTHRHTNAESLFMRYWRRPVETMMREDGELDIEESLSDEALRDFLTEGGFGDSDDENNEVTFNEAVADIAEEGFWGFYDDDNNVIHFWAAADVGMLDLIELFAHELGHVAVCDMGEKDHEIHEMLAGQIGAIARMSYRFAKCAAKGGQP